MYSEQLLGLFLIFLELKLGVLPFQRNLVLSLLLNLLRLLLWLFFGLLLHLCIYIELETRGF